MIDKDKFCELIRANEKAMYSLAYSLVKNDNDAADVIGETILRAYKNIGTLKSEDAFKTWLLKIVYNTAVEFIRKESKVIPMEEVEVTSTKTEHSIETKLALKEAVESLKQPYRTVITLFYYEDLPINEISKITNTTTISVKQQLSRARKQLREILREDFTNE